MSDILREYLNVFHIVGSDVCSATIQRRHCCASVAARSVYITLLTYTCVCVCVCVRQQYEGDTLLGFRDKNSCANAPQC
jgi:hypothetical protein